MVRQDETITEREMLEALPTKARLEPLKIRAINVRNGPGADATVELAWGPRRFMFDAEFKARSTPRVFQEAVRQAREWAKQSGRNPMIVLPYLRREQLELLERVQISGIDLCGNGVVTIPGELLVFRSGAPNRYRESMPTKYAYRGTTSLVARVFLCRGMYDTVSQIEEEVRARGGVVTLPTVSKALKRMEEDVLIDRARNRIRLLQPDALLEKLAGSYQAPRTRRKVLLALKGSLDGVLASLAVGSRVVLSGVSSAVRYAVGGRADRPVLYCEAIDDVLEAWRNEVEEAQRFADMELWETTDQIAFFDARLEGRVTYASPVQTYLELARGDKRDQQAAEQVRRRILKELARD